MSNIKLKDHNWAAEGIYDTNQSKSQQTINSDVSTKIGQATLQTSSQNLSGATNELKGRADTLDSKYDNVVTVANTQPSSEYNKVWLPLTVSEGTQVPTWAEHQALESSLNGEISGVQNLAGNAANGIAINITSVKTTENLYQGDIRFNRTDGRVYNILQNINSGDNIVGGSNAQSTNIGLLLSEIRNSVFGRNIAGRQELRFSKISGIALFVFFAYRYINGSETPCIWICDSWGNIYVLHQGNVATLRFDGTAFILKNTLSSYISVGCISFHDHPIRLLA